MQEELLDEIQGGDEANHFAVFRDHDVVDLVLDQHPCDLAGRGLPGPPRSAGRCTIPMRG